MQQSVLLVGNGRLARHFRRYFSILEMPYLTWSRQEQGVQVLAKYLDEVSVVMLLISDAAIESFIAEHQLLSKSIAVVHCSGSLSIPGVQSAHPLQTFSQADYTLEEYERIPFIVEQGKQDFLALFPLLKNPVYQIDALQKPYYHALCVMANNFSTLLWQHYFERMHNCLGIPPEATKLLLQGTLQNLMSDPDNSLTGPFSRKDFKVVEENLKSLEQRADPMHLVYSAFKQMILESDDANHS